ncbi:MAG: OmpA family protein [Paludibacter sp.]|nr:OmpA family protein [Paludibacter sp.]
MYMAMKKSNVIISLALCGAILVSGCASMSNTAKGGLLGGGAGAALGAGVGALFGKGKGAIIGAAVGTAVGATTGVIIGKKMDKQKEELAKIQGAQVETVKDANNLEAIKVTFAEGILFSTGKSTLSTSSKDALTKFAASLKNNAQTDVTIYGYTDNTGSLALNQRLSQERANAVGQYLNNSGIESARLSTIGKAWDNPVANNSTAAGRAQNRRVEVFISANSTMIQQANDGTLK